MRHGTDSGTGEKVRQTLTKHTDTHRLEFIYADLTRDENWDQAAAGCDFVLVSSVAAVLGGHERENRGFNESDWTDIHKTNYAYAKSKTLAEQAAWEFIRSAENQKRTELVSVNPSNVFGPVLDNRQHTSTEWVGTLLRREIPGLTRTQLNLVDVRDLVEMIKQAMITPDAAGKRFIANGATIPSHVLPDWLVRFFAIFVPKTKPVVDTLGWNYSLSTEQARSVLGWQARPYKGTIVEMAQSMIEQGMV